MILEDCMFHPGVQPDLLCAGNWGEECWKATCRYCKTDDGIWIHKDNCERAWNSTNPPESCQQQLPLE